MRYRFPLLAAVLIAIPIATAISVASDELLTSDTCGECHKAIYKMWRSSAHSKAMEDEIFLDAYRETKRVEGEQVSRQCLQCHAPLTDLNGDWDLQSKVTWEGVSCDVCHGLVSVDLSTPIPAQVFDIGDVKRGPIQDAHSSAHEVLYSELHTTSEVCAGCHQFTNAEGTPLMTTYTEWKGSGAARDGLQCQTCHMSETEGDVVDPRIARVPHAEVNLHEVPGGHSLEQLNKALRVVMEPERDGDTLRVEVRLINRGAGHAVPTGMPGRKVIFDLRVRPYGGEDYETQRVYAKVFADAEGKRITRDSRYFSRGVQLESDTRILPDETRTERFAIHVPKEATVEVKMKLTYEHSPMGGSEGRTRLTFFQEGRTLLP